MEKDMFPILKDYLVKQNYVVRAEVLNADIVAKKDDIVIVIEMKTSFSIHLMVQGIKRLAISDFVYLAIPRPTQRVLKSQSFKEKIVVARRLELGLILVDINHESVDVLLDPKTYHARKNHKKRRRLLKEFDLRQTTFNIGGVTKTKVITAYRELALLALEALKYGEKSTRFLREITGRKKIVDILQKNYYGWFERTSRGVYQITEKGVQALDDFSGVIEELKTKKET